MERPVIPSAPSPSNVIQTGPADASRVVLIHPVGLDLTYWDRQIEALRSTFRVVAFDLPGHGRSAGEAEEWSFAYGVEVIAQLIQAVSALPVHVVGASFGGMLAQALALARPQLVRSLTLIGTACTFDEPTREGMRNRARLTREGGMRAILQTSLERWFTQQTRTDRPELIDRVSKTVLADDPMVHAAIWDSIAGFEVSDQLHEVTCPALVMVGEHDPSTPVSAARRLAEGLNNSRVVIVPKASHMVMLEAPAVVNSELLSFFASH